MAESNERRKTSRKPASVTPKPDTRGARPLSTNNVRAEASPEEIRRLIAEAAYYRAQERGFEPGHELDDWIEAESEVMGRINGADR
jgi:Protein of unknown function (DUF2934)